MISFSSTGNYIRVPTLHVKLRRATAEISIYLFAMLFKYFVVSLNRCVSLKIEGDFLPDYPALEAETQSVHWVT